MLMLKHSIYICFSWLHCYNLLLLRFDVHKVSSSDVVLMFTSVARLSA